MPGTWSAGVVGSIPSSSPSAAPSTLPPYPRLTQAGGTARAADRWIGSARESLGEHPRVGRGSSAQPLSPVGGPSKFPRSSGGRNAQRRSSRISWPGGDGLRTGSGFPKPRLAVLMSGLNPRSSWRAILVCGLPFALGLHGHRRLGMHLSLASWEFIGLPGLAPSACCAAVGWPCICRCVSCDEAATSPLARFILSVGGCCAPVLVPVVWLLLCDAGPEPASLFAVRPVSQGPAHAVPAPRTMTEQPARISRFMFMRVSSSSCRAPRRSRR